MNFLYDYLDLAKSARKSRTMAAKEQAKELEKKRIEKKKAEKKEPEKEERKRLEEKKEAERVEEKERLSILLRGDSYDNKAQNLKNTADSANISSYFDIEI